jgi:hypothetical protein
MPVKLTESATTRVFAATRRVEGMPVTTPGADNKGTARTQKFWAELIAEDPATPGDYSWKMLVPDDGALVDSDPLEDSEDLFTARDINDAEGLIPGARVELKFAGYAVDGVTPRYLFGGGAGSGTSDIDIQVTGYGTITDAANRWRYTWVEVRPVQDGTWEAKPGGRTSAGSGYAYNTVEANNSDSGVQGNSIDPTTFPDGFELLPVQGNPVVVGRFKLDCNDVPFVAFQYENAVANPEGACPD